MELLTIILGGLAALIALPFVILFLLGAVSLVGWGWCLVIEFVEIMIDDTKKAFNGR